MSRHTKLLAFVTIILVLLCTLTEGKRHPPRRRHKRPSRLSSLLFRRNPRTRGPPDTHAKDSKRVFYYSLPPTTVKPRIILGEQLDFSELGIQNPHGLKTQSPSHSSLSALEQSYYDDDTSIPHPSPHRAPGRGPPPRNNPPSQKKRPRSRGPGYRLERPWKDHYVLSTPTKQKSQPLSVMPYLRNAGKELAGAYRAAIINSAKVAKFTGHTASKYLKGIRNLMTSSEDLRGRSDLKQTTSESDALESIQPPPQNSLEPTTTYLELEDQESSEDPKILPKVYLDWGGSFWRFLYNRAKNMPPPEKISPKN